MKGLLILGLLSVCLVGVYCDLISKVQPNRKSKCIAESGVDPKIIREIEETHQFIQDDKFGCFLACLLKHDGAFDENGAIKSTYLNFPKDSKAKECENLRGKNDCETANLVAQCVSNAE